MQEWRKIDRALSSELENFASFMTKRSIDGKNQESLSKREFVKMEKILEKPVPDKLVQEKLLEAHIKH
jgi:hypothetical protein